MAVLAEARLGTVLDEPERRETRQKAEQDENLDSTEQELRPGNPATLTGHFRASPRRPASPTGAA